MRNNPERRVSHLRDDRFTPPRVARRPLVFTATVPKAVATSRKTVSVELPNLSLTSTGFARLLKDGLRCAAHATRTPCTRHAYTMHAPRICHAHAQNMPSTRRTRRAHARCIEAGRGSARGGGPGQTDRRVCACELRPREGCTAAAVSGPCGEGCTCTSPSALLRACNCSHAGARGRLCTGHPRGR